MILGQVGDNTQTLQSMVEYLHNFPLDLAAAESTPVALVAPAVG